MPSLYFCVFAGTSSTANGDPLQEGVIAISGINALSDIIVGDGRKRRRVRVMADTACFVTWGKTPVALGDGTEGRPMPAEGVEYFEVEAGHKIAVIERV